MMLILDNFYEMDYIHLFQNILTMDYFTFGLFSLPILAVILFGLFILFKGKRKYDTMQRNGSKASQGPSLKTHKNDSNDFNITGNIKTLHQQQQQQQTNNKQRRTKGGNNNNNNNSNNKRQDNVAPNQQQQQQQQSQTQKRSSGFLVDQWFGTFFSSDKGSKSSIGEDNSSNVKHNPGHRNSTSSETGHSDDFNLSSGNEDATSKASTTYGKKSRKCRQKRQQQQRSNGNNQNNANNHGNEKQQTQRNKQYHQQQQQQPNQSHDTDNGPVGTGQVDVDEETKENRRITTNNKNSHGHHIGSNGTNGMGGNKNIAQSQQQQQVHSYQQSQQNKAGFNLRKQCTKAAAARAAGGGLMGSDKQQHQYPYNSGNSNSGGGVGGGNNKMRNSYAGNTLKNKTCGSGSVGGGVNKASGLSSASSSISLSSTGSSANSSPNNSPKNSPTASPIVFKRTNTYYRRHQQRLPTQSVLDHVNIDEQEFIQLLRRFIIDPNLLRIYGYPVESPVHEGCVEIFKCLPKHIVQANAQYLASNGQRHNNVINSYDGLYVNGRKARHNVDIGGCHLVDSGRGSSDSSPASVDSDSSETGEDETNGITAFYTPDGVYQIFSHYDNSVEKQCVRCKSSFMVTTEGEYLTTDACFYHWGKLNPLYEGEAIRGWQYNCCQGEEYSMGCCTHTLHVWTGAAVGLNGPYTDFVYTIRKPNHLKSSPKIYALDCEMSFTGRGLEVTKVTLVAFNGSLVYETFVQPKANIVDYNTRFSGITEEDLCIQSNSNLKTFEEVQQDLLEIIDADTLLIGHGLDNDLRVLRIVHKNVIDTSISFPHTNGFPFRRALRHLMKVLLNRDIQTGDKGHSSYEDSRACLELMIWKLRRELRIDFFD